MHIKINLLKKANIFKEHHHAISLQLSNKYSDKKRQTEAWLRQVPGWVNLFMAGPSGRVSHSTADSVNFMHGT